jgi:hypothetical protein
MVDGQIKNIYWLLMNFPDKLLTSCTCIEQGNHPSSHIGEIYFINTGIVTFLTPILCVSLESWVTDGWNTSIDLLWTFQITFLQVALLLSRLTFLPVTLEKCCINTGTVTFLTNILCVSLESLVTYGSNTCIDFLWAFLIIYSGVALLLSRSTYRPVTMKKYIISIPG